MTESPMSEDFYVTGGALRGDAPSYVARGADDELFASLQNGEYCYVLTARQMGKSSLMSRVAARLRASGTLVAVLDLQGSGQNLSPEQWYEGLLLSLGEQLNMADELDDLWLDQARGGPLQRWMHAIENGILARAMCEHKPVVIFVDEIDFVRSLAFPTDEFFAVIRACHERRVREKKWQLLAFCLLGVATPSELIADKRITPFNIGRRIELGDFSEQEAMALASGLPGSPKAARAALKRVLFWTGGHPYLTQRLCRAIVSAQADRGDRLMSSELEPSGSTANLKDIGRMGVDRNCHALFLDSGAQERDDNLLFVRDRMLHNNVDLSDLLDLYMRIWGGRTKLYSEDSDANPLISTLRLSGIVKSVGGRLQVRNRIYQRVFDQRWAAGHLPGGERLRQRAAYRRGVLRTAAVFSVILLLVGALITSRLNSQAHERLLRSRYDYARDMSLAQNAWKDGNMQGVLTLLHRTIPPKGAEDLRGFEWRYLWKLCQDAERNVLGRHQKQLKSVAFSPDGRWLASGGEDSLIVLWDVAAQKKAATLKCPPPGVMAVTFSPDSTQLACAVGSWKEADEKGDILLWDMATKTQTVLSGHTKSANTLAYSPDGKLLVSGSEDDTVLLWQVAERRIAKRFHASDTGVNKVAFSPDGRLFAACSGDGTTQIWDAASHREIDRFDGDTSGAMSVAFSPNGKLLAIGSRDGPIKLRDTALRRTRGVLQGHKGQVYSIAFGPRGDLAVSGGNDATVRLWNIAETREIAKQRGHLDAVWGVAFSPDGQMLASASFDRTVRLWPIEKYQEVPTLTLEDGATAVAFSPDDRWLATGSRDGSVHLWPPSIWRGKRHAAQMRPVALRHARHPAKAGFVLTDDRISALAFSPDGQTLAAANLNNSVLLWRLSGENALRVLSGNAKSHRGHSDGVMSVAFSPDGQWLATGGRDNTARLWDLKTYRVLPPLLGHQGWVRAVAFSPNGQWLATAAADRTIRIWNVERHRFEVELSGADNQKGQHTDTITAVAFSPDGQMLASASSDKTVRLWDFPRRRFIGSLVVQNSTLNSLAFSPDGKLLAAGSQDHSVKLWSVISLQEVMALTGHESGVTTVAFARDGNTLVTGGNDRTVKIWNASAARDIPRDAEHLRVNTLSSSH